MKLVLSRAQIQQIDALAVERYGIPSLILMENAGRGAAEVIHQRYGPDGRAVVFCGSGNNGGDGCVIARHLHNHGWVVRVIITKDPAGMSPDMATNFRIIERMGLEIFQLPAQTPDVNSLNVVRDWISPDDIVIDALLGTGFRGEVREPLAGLVDRINRAGARAVVAIDVPSGLDCETGVPSAATLCADLTITFVALKKGFVEAGTKRFLGSIEVVSIGAPRELIQQVADETIN